VENTPGTLTIGGFDTTPIAAGTSGSIVRMRFIVACPSCVPGQESEIVPANLIDDLSGFDICCGTFTYPVACPDVCDQPGLRVGPDARRGDGQTVVFNIDLASSPTAVAAFGLDLEYDHTMLDFVGCDFGDLTQGWIGLDCVENTPGVLTVGGFDTTPIAAGTSGTLVEVTFVANCPTCVTETPTELVPTALIDDIEGYFACCGTFTWSPCLPNGDVNADNMLSPRDALCVFEIFMNGGNVTPDCDVPGDCEVIAADADCNGILNSIDGLRIFDRFLHLGPPMPCFAADVARSAVSAVAPGKDAFEVPVDRAAELGNGLISVPVKMLAAAGSAAFSFEMHFDPSKVEFVGFDVKSAASKWLAIDANLVEPGRLIVGGFDIEGLTTEQVSRGTAGNGSLEIAQLHFRKLSDDATLEPVVWTGQLLESREGDEDPEETPLRVQKLDLGQPYPNPVRSLVSSLVSVPTHDVHHVRVSIYDVKGRLVKRVLDQSVAGGVHSINWDARSLQGELVSSGIYFMRMEVKEAGFMMTRKLVVLK
jgi:hypothetical protein